MPDEIDPITAAEAARFRAAAQASTDAETIAARQREAQRFSQIVAEESARRAAMAPPPPPPPPKQATTPRGRPIPWIPDHTRYLVPRIFVGVLLFVNWLAFLGILIAYCGALANHRNSTPLPPAAVVVSLVGIVFAPVLIHVLLSCCRALFDIADQKSAK
jgi:hypothetical protein